VDLLPKVSVYLAKERKNEGVKVEEIKPEVEELRFVEDTVDLLDWQRIYQETLEFKIQRNYWNLVFEKDTLRSILLSDRCTVLALPEVFEVKRKQDIEKLEEIALLAIKKYIDLFYRKNAKQFETENLRYDTVKQLPLPIISQGKQGYVVQIDKSKEQLIKKIKNLTKNLEALLKDDNETLPRIYIDNSLYVPMLLKNNEIIKISPAGLVESEKKFLEGFRKYWQEHKDSLHFDVFLLRNTPFSGVGFQLKWAGFYPDFIMWVKNEKKQTIVFIDPKGLEHTKGLDDEKIVFAGCRNEANTEVITIKFIEKELKGEVKLESFILSETPYEELIKGQAEPVAKEEYEKNHVLFLDDPDWPEKLFSYFQ
ncbi:MAG: hypothetical protein ACK4MM_03580, partial [Fervidobacterium sp.]